MSKKPLVHESVADVMVSMGVMAKKPRTVNAPNNTEFLTEQAKRAGKLVKETEAGDETDGNANGDVQVSNDAAGTEVKNTPAKTKVKVDDKKTDEAKTADGKPVAEKEMPDFIKAKIEAKKGEKGEKGEKKDGEKSEKKDDAADDKKDEKKDDAVDEAEKFYASRKNPVTFILWESKTGEPEIEVHGINEDELAPYGGKAPAMPAKWQSKAKDGGKVTQGSMGALVLYKTENMDKQSTEILAGGALRAVGWKPPMKGTGTKVTKGGAKD